MTSDPRSKVLVVIGTRPEAIKMAPVVAALEDRADRIQTGVALTGQHTELVDQALGTFGIRPDFDLAIMREGQSLYDVAHACLDGLRDVLRRFRPDMVLVQGDTATVFLGALVAYFERTRVGHVEAGLRSGDRWAPYPEEMFRRLADQLADLHFAPTPGAAAHLRAEGIPPGGIHVTGNTVVDALLEIAGGAGAAEHPALREALEAPGRFVLLTAHRRESFGAPIRAVFRAVRTLVDETPDLRVLYPVHPNPEVREPARELLAGHPRITLTDPLTYTDLVLGMRAAALILTDSGGIQEEAPTFGTPVLVLRDVTERPEGVEAGVATLTGTDPGAILAAARKALGARPERPSGPARSPYGDGRAGVRIADIVTSVLTGEARSTADWTGP